MNELHILNGATIDSSDPHDYFRYIAHRQFNYNSPTKRSFLSECIRQIHIMNGNNLPMISTPLEYNKTVIWHKLNNLMRPSKMTKQQILVQRVKRRLFRESKKGFRKCKKPQLNNSKQSEGVYFKPSRYIFGIRKIPRNFLDQATQNIRNDLRQNLKRKLTDAEDDDVLAKRPVHYHSHEGIYEVSQQLISKLSEYHGNMARHQPQKERSMGEQIKRTRNTEACRVSRRAQKLEEMLVEQHYRQLTSANEVYLEASVRSIFYMKTLMRLVVGQKENGNICV